MVGRDFDLNGILADAVDAAGLDDFGKDDYLPGLAKLLETYESNHFTEASRGSLRRRVMEVLISRLQVEDAWKRHPEVKQMPIAKPLFLTGLPRTGTSALLNVLANDPAARELKLWEARNPAPMERLQPGEEDPRYLQLKAELDHMNATSDFKKIHYMTADSAEECIFLTNHTFQDAAYGVEVFLEPYASFYKEVDRRPQYQYHADLLRLLQWQRPAERWLLKTPSHICHLDIILEQHPDCGIIVTHRNPLEVIGSYCSMMMAVLPEQTVRMDPGEMGRRMLAHLGGQMDQSMAIRESLPAGRIVDVMYRDFVDDTMGVVDSIYLQLGLPYPDAVRAAISAYVDDHPRGKHGSHDYRLEEFGLTHQQVLSRFANYIETYNIPI